MNCCLMLLACSGGSLPAQETNDKYVDGKFDFSITVAAPWTSARLEDYSVPGVPRAAYSQPGAIDGKGAVKTSQHWVAIPREKDVLVLLLTSPSDKFKENQQSFEQALKTLMVGGKQTDAQSESK